MSIGIIELNDAGLRVASNEHAEQIVSESPGLAVLEGNTLLLGADAMAQSRLHPLHSNSLFWHRLSTEPLSFQSSQYRHHADLAYSQLLALHQSIPQCEQVIFALPATYTREQMSLLLGIVDQCPFQAVGLVDSAVAASLKHARRQKNVHLDIQLHQCVITEMQLADGQLAGQRVEVLAGLGLQTFLDRWAKAIANQFIDQCRFDPLHSAASEQALYDQLAQWMSGYRDEGELFMELSGKRIKLARDPFIQAVRSLYEQISQRVAQLVDANSQLLVADRLAALPGFTELFSQQAGEMTVLSATAVMEGIHRHVDAIVQGSGALSFNRVLPADVPATESQAVESTTPSQNSPHASSESPATKKSLYLLTGHTAYPVKANPLYLNLEQGQLVADISHADCSLQAHGDAVLCTPLSQTATGDPRLLHAGDTLGGVRLIEVLQGHGTP